MKVLRQKRTYWGALQRSFSINDRSVVNDDHFKIKDFGVDHSKRWEDSRYKVKIGSWLKRKTRIEGLRKWRSPKTAMIENLLVNVWDHNQKMNVLFQDEWKEELQEMCGTHCSQLMVDSLRKVRREKREASKRFCILLPQTQPKPILWA